VPLAHPLLDGRITVHSAPRIAPPIVEVVEGTPSLSAAMAELDAGWTFEQEAAATDGGMLGNPDAKLGHFPPPASDAEIADLVDDITTQLCRPAPRKRASARKRVPNRVR
jgi:hypothetical protein